MNELGQDTFRDPELAVLRNSMREKSEFIRTLVRGVSVPLSEGCVTVTSIRWASVPQSNVRMRLCSLDVEDPEHTAINMAFDEGGYLGPHHHQEALKIFCISGSVIETCSGQELQEGEVLSIPSGQRISLKSDCAYLTITWKPPLRTRDVKP